MYTKRMQSIHRMRRFLKIVDQLNKDQTDDDFLYGFGIRGGVHRSECIDEFRKKYPKYSETLANELCDSALARKYVSNTEPISVPKDEQRLAVDPLRGRDLLAFSGYLNEVAGSVSKIPPILTWLVSIVALVVSIFAISNN
jgi:hypothetical protein